MSMYYFIPAWYSSARKWYQESPLWYRVFEKMSFDDTINQLKMFQLAQKEATLLQLSYNPQFRYFQHKHDLLSTRVWSFFDDVQNIHKLETQVIDFKDLEWPKGVQFIYTPFMVLARLDGKVIAEIQFAENGNLLYIQFKENGQDSKRHIFDDRGFLSSVLYQGQSSHHDYLNEKGVWQIREWLTGDKTYLEINPEADRLFKEAQYSSWEQLIQERVTSLKQAFLSEEDIIVIAADKRHNEFLLKSFSEQRKVVSLYGKRFSFQDKDDLTNLAQGADFFVVDQKRMEDELRDNLVQLGYASTKISTITPFDSRLRLGRSQTIKELIIYFLIDGLSQAQLEANLELILEKMSKEPMIHLKLVSYNHQHKLKDWESWVVKHIADRYDQDLFWEIDLSEGENQLEEDAEFKLKSITFDYYHNELQIITALDTARLVIDLSAEPDTYTQIASLSAGVPQLNQVETDYVTHQENGWIVADLENLGKALDHYFQGLANWNKALVYAVQKMGDYTSGRLIEQWETFLKE